MTALTARELLDAFAARSISPVEALEQCARAIDGRDGELRAFTTLCIERAMGEAREAEAAWARGAPTGPLCGVPLGVKDLFDTEGVETAYGSPLYAGNVPAADAPAVARARAAGAIVVGKTRTHEFAWGMTMRHARLGPARNPHDPARTPGGSSGGSAVAVAAGMVPLAIGSDTGGSIRLPASLCGVVGLKPTHGAIPLEGVWPLVPAFDHAGPITRTVDDAALLFAVLAGKEPGSSSAGKEPGSFSAVGIHVAEDLAPAVQAALGLAAEALGARPVTLPDGLAAYAPIFNAGAVRTHVEKGLWPGRPDAHDPTVRERLEIAARTTPGQVVAAFEEKERVAAETEAAFAEVDVVVSAICAVAPPPRLDSTDDLRADVSRLACLQDLLGLPAVAVPVTRDETGMPVGVQLTGRRGEEDVVLAAAQRLSTAIWASPSSIETTGR